MRLAGLEPATSCSGGMRSIQLSYRRGEIKIAKPPPGSSVNQASGGTSRRRTAPPTGGGRGGARARNKPSSVPLRGRIIHLGLPLPAASCGLPGTQAERATPRPLFGLAAGGVCRAARCYQEPGALLPHRFTLACAAGAAIGGLLSVALSVAFRRPGVTRHPALRSSDFPPRARRPTAILTRTLCSRQPAQPPPCGDRALPYGYTTGGRGLPPGGGSHGEPPEDAHPAAGLFAGVGPPRRRTAPLSHHPSRR